MTHARRTPGDIQAALQELIANLEAQPAVLAAVVFGSAAVGRLRPESDLDLALLFAEGRVPDAFAALELRAALEQRLCRDGEGRDDPALFDAYSSGDCP